jgi:hypothetical protein
VYLQEVRLFGEPTVDQWQSGIPGQVDSLNFVEMLVAMASILLHLIIFK